MKIRQPRIAVTVPVEIVPSLVLSTGPTVLACYSGGESRRISEHEAPHDVPQEIVDAVRAAVDWNES